MLRPAAKRPHGDGTLVVDYSRLVATQIWHFLHAALAEKSSEVEVGPLTTPTFDSM